MKSNLNLETGRSHTSTSLPPLRTHSTTATHSTATRFRRRLGRAQLPLLALLALLALALTLPVRAAPPYQSPPFPITLDATGVGEFVATLNGTFDPSGGPVGEAWFEWSGGANIDLPFPVAGVVSVEVGSAGAPLSPGTTYGFSLWAINARGEAWGGGKTFTTLPTSPDFNYTTNNGTLTITRYFGAGGAVAIPDTINGLSVTSIGGYSMLDGSWAGAFDQCASVTSVTIPNSVTNLGQSAFYECNGLTNVTIPDSVTSIGQGAFSGCSSLIHVIIPNSVTSIGDEAFYGCTSLTSVTIPDSVTNIGDYAFANCTSLTNVAIPDSVTNIGDDAFGGCTSLTSITIPSSVTSIGLQAFCSCTSLTNISIPSSVTSIGEGAFQSCTSLTSIIIPSNVISIGDFAFAYCTSLTNVYFQGNAPSADSTVFNNATNVTVYYLPGTTGWGATFGGRLTALWFLPNPLILNNSFGVKTNQFGFIISWATNVPVVVEACMNLANPTWTPVQTNTLTGGSSYFSDPQWTNYPSRFYRLHSP